MACTSTSQRMAPGASSRKCLPTLSVAVRKEKGNSPQAWWRLLAGDTIQIFVRPSTPPYISQSRNPSPSIRTQRGPWPWSIDGAGYSALPGPGPVRRPGQAYRSRSSQTITASHGRLLDSTNRPWVPPAWRRVHLHVFSHGSHL